MNSYDDWTIKYGGMRKALLLQRNLGYNIVSVNVSEASQNILLIEKTECNHQVTRHSRLFVTEF